MTVTTLATVGYGEVRPLDASGKLFTISLIVLGVVALAASIDAGGRSAGLRRAASSNQEETHAAARQPPGPLCRLCLRPRRAGRRGRAAHRGSPCSWSSLSPELAEPPEEHGVPHLPADPTEETALQQAGIQRARGLLCAMDSDAANVFITLDCALNPAP